MSNTLAIEAFVGSDPEVRRTNTGAAICSFRAAVNHRRLDNSTGEWVNNGTSWYTVTSYGILAENVATQVQKGSAVLVIGDLKVRDWEANGRRGTSAEITANAVGPNLLFASASASAPKPAVQTPNSQTPNYAPRPSADMLDDFGNSLTEESSPASPRVIADEDIPF
jgi:single-strand DNA-binding protein